jgi:hypothetical protein
VSYISATRACVASTFGTSHLHPTASELPLLSTWREGEEEEEEEGTYTSKRKLNFQRCFS